MTAHRPPAHRLRHWASAVLLGLGWGQAWGVVTTFPIGGTRTILLQVGAAGGTVNTVRFNVSGASTSPSPMPATGVPDATTPTTTPSGGVRVRMRATINNSSARTLSLVVNSQAGMTCITPATCGTVSIPFSKVSWVSHEKDGTNDAVDIQSGSFNGTTTQTLVSYFCCNPFRSFEMANTLVFTYANDTLYPAGQYRGRVTFTAYLQ